MLLSQAPRPAVRATRQGHPLLLSPARPQVKQSRLIYSRESACPGPGPLGVITQHLGCTGVFQ